MKKNILLMLMVFLGAMFQSETVAQVGGIPIMTTILGDGGTGNDPIYYANENCKITIRKSIFVANLDQYTINQNTPLTYGQTFYLPTNVPPMSLEYNIGIVNGSFNLNSFEYFNSYISPSSGQEVHVFRYFIEITINVVTECEDADQDNMISINSSFSLVDPSKFLRPSGHPPYPICDYMEWNELFPCELFNFDVCVVPVGGISPVCDNESLTSWSGDFLVQCHENCGETDNSNRIVTGTNPAVESIIHVYPNPFVDRLRVRIPEYRAKAEISLEIYDLRGNKVQQFNDLDVNARLVDVDLAHLPSGMYILSVTMNTSRDLIRIFKE